MTPKTAKEIGKKGGRKTFEKYGKEYMSRLAKRRWKKLRFLKAKKRLEAV